MSGIFALTINLWAATNEVRFTPGGKWLFNDTNRPAPVVVTPPSPSTNDQAGRPPSDAVILFNGTDLSAFHRFPWEDDPDKSDAPKWKVENGYTEVIPKTGTLMTREKFGDCQIHVEWATPAKVEGDGQWRGNSGIFIEGHPEVQVLDSYENSTYPDGQAAALYGEYPPLVNASRPPGQWQSYDITYIAPRLDEHGAVTKPALYTVFHNGVLVHHAVEVFGTNVKCSIGLQDHLNPVRFRNVWVRPLRGYDSP